MALNFRDGALFPKEMCNNCEGNPCLSNKINSRFLECNIGFEKCVFSSDSISLMGKSVPYLKTHVSTLKSLLGEAISELEKSDPSDQTLCYLGRKIFKLRTPFRQAVIREIQSNEMPELAAHLRKQFLHNFDSILNFACNSLYPVHAEGQNPKTNLGGMKLILGRAESFEYVLANMQNNPELMDHLLSLVLPSSSAEAAEPSP